MKRYIYRFFALLTTVLGAWTFTGCADDVDTYMTEESGCFNLVVTVPDESATRATDAEVGLNEFKVTKLHLYFYKSAGHDDATSQSVHEYMWAAEEGFNTTKTFNNVPLPADALLDGGLFGAGTTDTQCIVYAVANVDEDTLPDGPQTIADLKALGITSTFNETVTQPSFAMDGQATVTMDRTARRATGEITLQRAAAKITLAVSLPENITKGEIEYTPKTDNMHVWIGNGVKNSKLNIAADDITANDLDGALYSNTITTGEGNHGTGFNGEGEGKYKYVQNMPFYSYPNKWESTSPDGNCYLTLVLPWTYNGGQITTYYRIPVQLEDCKIERNMHYDIRVSISRLGSTEQEPIDVEVDWNYAIPWNTHGENVDIKQVRYLLLNNNNFNDALGAYTFDMDNTTSISIPVGTSHDVEIASVTMKWRDYYNNTDREQILSTSGYYTYSDIDSYKAGSNYAGIEFDSSTSMLKFTRDLRHIAWSNSRPSISENDAFCSYTFDIVLRHKDDYTQTATVRITQYPPIYITAQENKNSGHRFINNNNTSNYNNLGYVARSNDGEDDEYLGSASSSDNKNTYILNITRFDSDESNEYIIGDPRSQQVDNLGNSWSVSGQVANSTSSTTRKLRYYYPTDDTGSKNDFIAPQIRIASQWGVTQPVTYKGAQRRCASYQENGRPAGRWRMPTVAEIRYIANLSSKQYIPYLFGDEADRSIIYWCGSGAVEVRNRDNPPKVNVVNNPSGRNYVRCVYDEWYWGNDVLEDKTKFTWGDRPRDISGN